MPDTAPLSSRAQRGTFPVASKAPRYARGDSCDSSSTISALVATHPHQLARHAASHDLGAAFRPVAVRQAIGARHAAEVLTQIEERNGRLAKFHGQTTMAGVGAERRAEILRPGPPE